MGVALGFLCGGGTESNWGSDTGAAGVGRAAFEGGARGRGATRAAVLMGAAIARPEKRTCNNY